MIEVVIKDKDAIEVINIVFELRESGLKTNEDFEFVFHRAEWDGEDSLLSPYKKYTTFRFKDPSIASWFSLKYNV